MKKELEMHSKVAKGMDNDRRQCVLIHSQSEGCRPVKLTRALSGLTDIKL